jgi:hypothetical protein
MDLSMVERGCRTTLQSDPCLCKWSGEGGTGGEISRVMHHELHVISSSYHIA